MELAALASAAVPGLSPTAVFSVPDDNRDFDAAVVTDDEGNHWRVRSPRHGSAGFRLETEIQVLTGFTPAVRARLPFRVPSVAGAVQIDNLRTFVYHQMPGIEHELDELVALPERAREDIGRILAGIHSLPKAVVEAADLPAYSADQARQRLLNELDQAALSGDIPAVLLRRWEDAFEEPKLWGFETTATHGDLHENNLLIDRQRAVGVTNWTDLHWGDPARDLAWLASVDSDEFRQDVLNSYQKYRETAGSASDDHIMQRAALLAEFALAQWMLSGQAHEDEQIIAEAREMLHELAEDIEATGGQDVGSELSKPQKTAVANTESVTESVDEDESNSDDAVITDFPVDGESSSEQPADAETSDTAEVAEADADDATDFEDSQDDDPADETDSTADEKESVPEDEDQKPYTVIGPALVANEDDDEPVEDDDSVASVQEPDAETAPISLDAMRDYQRNRDT